MSEQERWRPNWGAIGLVIRKDLTAVRRSKAIVLPMILVPVILIVVLPVSVGLLARNAPTDQIDTALSSPLVRDLVRPILDLPERERIVVLVLGYLLSPLLLVIPLMVSAVLAADAFAGEKERRTLESLLHLPVNDRDLFLAKVLGAFLPAVLITWVGSVLYVLLCNALAWPVLHRPFLPFAQFAVMILWVAPAVAALALGLLVIVSSRAKTTQEANQLGGAVILPLIFVAAAQASALLLAPVVGVLAVGLLLWGVSLSLIFFNARRFTRDRLASAA
jgi:ABC-2 type transport system permease protein